MRMRLYLAPTDRHRSVTWVAALGDAQHGFPYLSGAGRLVLKDVTLMAGAWLVLADSARAVLREASAPAARAASTRARASSSDTAARASVRATMKKSRPARASTAARILWMYSTM